jgi:hypothetical protein
MYIRGWIPISKALACDPRGPTQADIEFFSSSSATEQKKIQIDLYSPICHCALEAFIKHSRSATSAILNVKPEVARYIESQREVEYTSELRQCALSTMPTRLVIPSSWFGCGRLCLFSSTACILAGSCLTSIQQVARFGVNVGTWNSSQAVWALAAGISSIVGILIACCYIVDGLESSWPSISLLAFSMLLGCILR